MRTSQAQADHGQHHHPRARRTLQPELLFEQPGAPQRGATQHGLHYTTGHLTAVTALKALDPETEAVSASMKVPDYKTFWRVTLPSRFDRHPRPPRGG